MRRTRLAPKPGHGEYIAAEIAGARPHIVAGLGLTLPDEVHADLAELILAHAGADSDHGSEPPVLQRDPRVCDGVRPTDRGPDQWPDAGPGLSATGVQRR